MTVGQLARYVYGIVPADARMPEDVTGLDDASVELVAHEGVGAIVSAVDVGRPLGNRADLVGHSRVLDAFAAQGAVVPVRFGSMLPETADVVGELLAPNLGHFSALLAELHGRTQFNLRARYVEEVVLSEVISEHPEIARLRAETRGQPEEATHYARVRLGELVATALTRKRQADAEVILDAVLAQSEAHRTRDGDGVDHLMDVAFLVDVDRRAAFEQAAEGAATAMHGRATLRLLGPSAPYDFVPEE